MTPLVFGQTAAGETVHAITLSAGDITARILTYGAILNAVHLTGRAYSLSPGSDSLAAYEDAAPNHGPLIAPVVNRLTGAQAPIGGRMHRFEANQNGRHTLHAGAASTGRKVWRVDADGDTGNAAGTGSVTLRLTLADGEGGFPGTREVTARFEVQEPATLRLTVTATTDAPTLFNTANHSYWNLDGSPAWQGHRLRIAADRYLPTTDENLPTGEIAAVDATDYDFRSGPAPAPGVPPLDHNFCLSDAPGDLRDVLWLTGTTGLTMTLATTAPGLQVFDGRRGGLPGDAPYRALAIEAQGWPDAPNHAGFPSIGLAPGETYRQITEWRFSRG